jgi:hypothetical protein
MTNLNGLETLFFGTGVAYAPGDCCPVRFLEP